MLEKFLAWFRFVFLAALASGRHRRFPPRQSWNIEFFFYFSDKGEDRRSDFRVNVRVRKLLVMLKYNRDIKKIYIIINKKNVRRRITKTKKRTKLQLGHTVGLQRGGVVYNVEEKKRKLGKKEREACYVKKVSVGHVMVQVCFCFCFFFCHLFQIDSSCL